MKKNESMHKNNILSLINEEEKDSDEEEKFVS